MVNQYDGRDGAIEVLFGFSAIFQDERGKPSRVGAGCMSFESKMAQSKLIGGENSLGPRTLKNEEK